MYKKSVVRSPQGKNFKKQKGYEKKSRGLFFGNIMSDLLIDGAF